MDSKYLVAAVQAAALAASPALADPAPAPAPIPADSGDVRADAGDADGEPPHTPSGSIAVGAGFSSDDGFIASAALRQPNLFGRGQDLSLTARISQRRQLFLLHFGEPHLFDSDIGLGIDLYNRVAEWPGFTRSATGGALTLSRPLAAHTHGYVGYRLEDVSVDPTGEVGVAARMVEPGTWDPALMMRGGLLSAARAGIVHDTRDQPLYPRRGTFAGAWIERAAPEIGSEIDLTRGAVFAAQHVPLGPLTLHLGGAVEGVTSRDPRGVPLSERLQLDGSSELRGYAPGSLGPSLGGVALGGNLKATARGELEFPLLSRIGLSGSIFYDAGGVMDLEGRSGNAIGQSVGVGVTWRSPIGPLQLGVAYPLDGDGEPTFFIGIGMTF
jgi:outer membrane protein insertion porin family